MSVSIKVQACTSGRNIKKYVNVWSYIILELIQYRWRKQTMLKFFFPVYQKENNH